MSSPLSPGTKLGRYEIHSQLGAGGMGEVYLAEDKKLERKVALKILPAGVAAHHDRMRRFVQEARAVSALNHPNIITIYEIEQIDSLNFIATEFIDGETLRRRTKGVPLKPGEVLDVSAQIAGALAAAHAAGIVHRDIKPENVMLRRDGIVKVLDFGLAKLTERPPSELVDTEAPTSVKTDPGTVIGTALYMSPEQARGLQVDARTDIFSLGVLIYEMVAGRLPFEGSNTNEILASILSDKEPSPLARYAREVPAELERIVSKALRKNRHERYQTIKDLLLDLKSLKQRIEFDAEVERSRPSEMSSDQMAAARAPATLSGQPPQTTPTESFVNRVKRKRRGLVVALALLVIAATGLAYFLYFAKPAKAIDSIAVLPLVNTSGDPNTEYLSDGISEALINSLTELQQLRVIARTTAFRYRGKEVDPQQVGRELNVRAVLTGRVRQTGDTLNIQVDLVDATTGAQLWGKQYSSKVSDALSVQQEISREISKRLRLKLTSEEQRQLAKRDTSNAEAYQFYLRGSYHWNKRGAENLKKAIEQFQQAIDRDPNYALAYAGIANTYILLAGDAQDYPERETLQKAKAYAQRALQIDDSLAEVHTSMGAIDGASWQWDEAEKEYKRAIELNPNYPTAHHWYSFFLRWVGRIDEALAESKRAQEIDPLSPAISNNLARVYLVKGDISSSLEESKKVIDLDPIYWPGHTTLGWAYLKQGDYTKALAELQKAVESSGRLSEFLSDLGYGYAVSGKRPEALAIIKELEGKYAQQEASGAEIAAVYAGLGENDRAFAWLEKDFLARKSNLQETRWLPEFESLRGDARYADLLRRMGLNP
jgi:serine/threonine-protein kinase